MQRSLLPYQHLPLYLSLVDIKDKGCISLYDSRFRFSNTIFDLYYSMSTTTNQLFSPPESNNQHQCKTNDIPWSSSLVLHSFLLCPHTLHMLPLYILIPINDYRPLRGKHQYSNSHPYTSSAKIAKSSTHIAIYIW